MASEAWPVCALIFQDETPAAAALVARPALREWPAYLEGSSPTAAARA